MTITSLGAGKREFERGGWPEAERSRLDMNDTQIGGRWWLMLGVKCVRGRDRGTVVAVIDEDAVLSW